MRRLLSVVLLVGLFGAGCSGSSDGQQDAAAAPKFTAVLDDGGLKLPSGETKAGNYVVAFEDRRSNPKPGEIARLQFRASGPTFVLMEVDAGQEKPGTLLQNLVASVAVNGIPLDVPVTNQLNVVATEEFPTPAT